MRTTDNNSRQDSGDQIGQLVRLAGRRETVPVKREERVKATVRGLWREEVRRRSRRRLTYWTAGLAAALLLAGLRLGIWERPPTEAPPPEILVATVDTATGTFTLPSSTAPVVGRRLARDAVLGTGADGRLALRLDGGLALRLAAGTRLRIASASVLHLEQGALYVDSQPGDETVEIHTRFGVARNVGTRFEVRLGDDSLRLRVREGKVTLDRDGSRHEAEAGVELTADADGVSRQPVAPYGRAWDWVVEMAPAFDLEGRTLAEFLDWLARETGWQVRFRDPSATQPPSTVILSGPVVNLDPEETPRAVLATCGLTPRLDGGTLWIEPFRR